MTEDGENEGSEMSAQQTQRQIAEQIIKVSPVRLKLDSVNQLGDEAPDTHRYGFGCLDCGDKFIYITFEQGKENEWQSMASRRVQEHIDQCHK